MTDAKEVGVGNPAEETFCHPDDLNIAKGGSPVKGWFTSPFAPPPRGDVGGNGSLRPSLHQRILSSAVSGALASGQFSASADVLTFRGLI